MTSSERVFGTEATREACRGMELNEKGLEVRLAAGLVRLSFEQQMFFLYSD
jgi:hypothetical protein